MKYGISVECTICGKRKSPIGRSSPLEICGSLCDSDCSGYREAPYVGSLWPGESEKSFGYPVGLYGWEEN